MKITDKLAWQLMDDFFCLAVSALTTKKDAAYTPLDMPKEDYDACAEWARAKFLAVTGELEKKFGEEMRVEVDDDALIYAEDEAEE